MSADNEEYLPAPGEVDLLADDETASRLPAAARNGDGHATGAGKKPREKFVRFYSLSELAAYEPPANQNLLGDYHLQRGAPSVLAGPPGCGKSRAALSLAVAGARGHGDWLGYPIHSQFRTLILQNENGLTRLHRDMAGLDGLDQLDEWVRVSSPPPCGLALHNPLFRDDLKKAVKEFAPQLVIVDPWNACVRDAMEKDFQEALTRLREVLAESPHEPACLILHHLRKPKSDDRHRGRNLANLLSGSYVLVSVARSVLVMQPASDDTTDARVVLTCAKNNDGELGQRSAWERQRGGFAPVPDFDFDAFDGGDGATRESKVREEHVIAAFGGLPGPQRMSDVVRRLEEVAGVKRTAAYDALKTGPGGRFAHLLVRQPGTAMVSLKDQDVLDV